MDLHVESLVDQSADLLDRASATRQRFDETSKQMFHLLLDLREYMQQDQVHRREEAAGSYDHGNRTLISEWSNDCSRRLGGYPTFG
jgi:hypothetical protein